MHCGKQSLTWRLISPPLAFAFSFAFVLRAFGPERGGRSSTIVPVSRFEAHVDGLHELVSHAFHEAPGRNFVGTPRELAPHAFHEALGRSLGGTPRGAGLGRRAARALALSILLSLLLSFLSGALIGVAGFKKAPCRLRLLVGLTTRRRLVSGALARARAILMASFKDLSQVLHFRLLGAMRSPGGGAFFSCMRTDLDLFSLSVLFPASFLSEREVSPD